MFKRRKKVTSPPKHNVRTGKPKDDMTLNVDRVTRNTSDSSDDEGMKTKTRYRNSDSEYEDERNTNKNRNNNKHKQQNPLSIQNSRKDNGREQLHNKRRKVGSNTTKRLTLQDENNSSRSTHTTNSKINSQQQEMERTISRYQKWAEMSRTTKNTEHNNNSQENISVTNLSFLNHSLDPEKNLFQQMTQMMGISEDQRNSNLFRQFLMNEKEKHWGTCTLRSESSIIPSREAFSPSIVRRGPPTQIRTYYEGENALENNIVSQQMVNNISRAVADYVIGTFFKSVSIFRKLHWIRINQH